MRSQFCQLTSALFASVGLVAMAVGLLAFASTALASDPIAPIDPGVVLADCKGCNSTGPCNTMPYKKCYRTNNNQVCLGSQLCEDCVCRPIIGNPATCSCQL